MYHNQQTPPHSSDKYQAPLMGRGLSLLLQKGPFHDSVIAITHLTGSP